jgi:hypothetical protein
MQDSRLTDFTLSVTASTTALTFGLDVIRAAAISFGLLVVKEVWMFVREKVAKWIQQYKEKP